MVDTVKQIEELAIWMMNEKGMPSLVINAPEDGDDIWRVYPSGHPAIGCGASLTSAVTVAHETMEFHKINYGPTKR